MTTSRNFDFDYTHLPNYESLTADDFFFGSAPSNRISMSTNGTTAYLQVVILNTGTIRVNWNGDAKKDNCSVSATLYAIAGG